MPLPDLGAGGCLPPGLHAASLAELEARFGILSAVRQQFMGLLREVVGAANAYPTLKRVLVWGSFVTANADPGDLDYSLWYR